MKSIHVRMITALCLLILISAGYGESSDKDGVSPSSQRQSIPAGAPPVAAIEPGVRQLLALVWQEMPASDQEKYEKELRSALLDKNNNGYRAELCRRIADMKFEKKQYWRAILWYRKAINADSTLRRQTSAGYRLTIAERIVAYGWSRLVSVAVLCLVFALLAARFLRTGRKFDAISFIKRSGVLGGICLVCVLAWGMADLYFARRATESLAALPDFKYLITAPVVIFSFLDPDNAGLLLAVLGAVILPIVTAVSAGVLGRPFPRPVSLALVVAVAAASWMLVFTTFGFDDKFYLRGVPSSGRFYFRGDIETVLQKHPRKVLKANPRLLESDNGELREFIEDHFPQGLPGQEKKNRPEP